MRVRLCFIVMSGLVFGGAASAQDVCGNIRLSVAEQIDCRARLTNALGEADRQRTQQEYEDRIRRANDALITPPILSSRPPIAGGTVPNAGRPAVPRAPATPESPTAPGAAAPATSSTPGGVAPAPGEVKTPGGALPAGRALVPDLTAPDPAASPLPPISPLPSNPAGVFPPS